MNKAIFLDRDGVLIEDMGYVSKIEDGEIFDFVYESLLKVKEEYLLFIVTNQIGVGLGKVTQEEVDNVNNHIVEKLNEKGIKITEVYCCSHTKESNCDCRKPKTMFVDMAIEKYDIDIENSFVIGDHPSDVNLAKNSGATGIYVLSGHGIKHKEELTEDEIITEDLRGAIEYILTK